jgi:hypothetical protein
VPSRVCLWAGRGFARPTRVRVKTKKRRLCVVYSSCKGSIHHAKAKRGCHVFARVAGSACAQLNQRRRGPARVERDWRSRAFSDVDSNHNGHDVTTDVYPRENCIAPAMVFIVWTTDTTNGRGLALPLNYTTRDFFGPCNPNTFGVWTYCDEDAERSETHVNRPFHVSHLGHTPLN